MNLNIDAMHDVYIRILHKTLRKETNMGYLNSYLYVMVCVKSLSSWDDEVFFWNLTILVFALFLTSYLLFLEAQNLLKRKREYTNRTDVIEVLRSILISFLISNEIVQAGNLI